MTFETYFLVSSFAFVATGALALALTGRLDPISLFLYALALGGAWLAERRRPSVLVSRKRAVRFSVVTVPICIADAVLLGNPYLALGRFTLLLSGIKLFQVKEDSDWVWLYALAFCEVLLAASMTIDATFLISLGLFLFFAVSTLGAFEVRRARRGLSPVEEETAAIRDGRPRPLRRSRALSWVTGLQLLFVAVVSVPLFLALPRFGGGGIGETFASAGSLSGFSESVRLGELGPIKLNPTVVMHVELENDHGQYLRWRGIALETFDNRTWKVADRPNGGRGMLTPPSSPKRFVRLAPAEVELRPSQLVAQKVYLEPVATTTIFAASRVLGIEDAPGGLRIDETGSLSVVRRSGEPLAYTAYSDVEPFDEEVLAADVSTDYPEEVRRYDLQLPVREPLDPRVAEFARETVGDAATPFEKARRLERRLKSFTYSLVPRRVDARLDPLSDFVLNTQTGHCELFASSMVLMLRELGIPARVVNGFQMGEYNDLTGSYTVRQLDAHSWVEVYFAGPDRWVEFDPTPAVGINTYIHDWTAQVRKSMEALHLVWSRYVVSLGTNEQASLLRGAQRWVHSVDE
jgi:transglutaminase-like putative cysteine protease